MQAKAPSHIYWFCYFDLSEPSVRYRARYPLEHLRDRYGIPFTIVYPGYGLRTILHFIRVFFSVLLFRKKDSVIVFQKIYTGGVYATALKILLFFCPKNTLYDIDDAEHTRRPDDTIRHFLKRCTRCCAGSRALMDYIRPYNENVYLLTSPVIPHGEQRQGKDELCHLGWIGYYGAHRESLMQLVFPALLQVDFPLQLTLLGVAGEDQQAEIQEYFRRHPHIAVHTPLALDWQNEPGIYRIIKSFTIGVAPLLDGEFNRAKSAFKMKQCLSCGVPVLASNVGEHPSFLNDGINGYLCDTPGDFLRHITAIHTGGADHYQRLSSGALDTFSSFSMDGWCATFLELLAAR